MEDYVAAMKPGLGALAAIMDEAQPAAEDMEAVRRIAPECAERPADELACQVIQTALRDLTKETRRSFRLWHACYAFG